jgi:hypothetical protein
MDQKNDKSIDQKIFDTTILKNGQTLFIRDLSRSISADAFQVTMEARIEVAVTPAVLSPETLGNTPFEEVIKKVGDTVLFEHREVRNFIMADDRQSVFEKLVDTFRTNLVPYLSKPEFPARLVMKEFRD